MILLAGTPGDSNHSVLKLGSILNGQVAKPADPFAMYRVSNAVGSGQAREGGEQQVSVVVSCMSISFCWPCHTLYHRRYILKHELMDTDWERQGDELWLTFLSLA